jgi:hypothetical protein
VRPGKNTLSVRVWDRFGGGGFTGREDELVLRSAVEKEAPQGFYHPDYLDDFRWATTRIATTTGRAVFRHTTA